MTIGEGGIKLDGEKPRFDLLCGDFLFDVATVMTHGAKKYADRNYMGLKWTRVFSACMRHLWAWFIGDEIDKETGQSHLAHAGCCVMMLYEMQKVKSNDDRPKTDLPIHQGGEPLSPEEVTKARRIGVDVGRRIHGKII